MQSIAKDKSQLLKSKQFVSQNLLRLGIVVVSLAMGLTGIFALAAWAETAPLHHAMQHLLIFVSGVGFGGSLISGFKQGGKNEG